MKESNILEMTLSDFLKSEHVEVFYNGRTYQKGKISVLLSSLEQIKAKEWGVVKDYSKIRKKILDVNLRSPLSSFLEDCRHRGLLQAIRSDEREVFLLETNFGMNA